MVAQTSYCERVCVCLCVSRLHGVCVLGEKMKKETARRMHTWRLRFVATPHRASMKNGRSERPPSSPAQEAPTPHRCCCYRRASAVAAAARARVDMGETMASLSALLRERDALLPVRAAVPAAWALLEAEIARHNAGARKRIKLRVPCERYPDYNFVGRLLGPRGSTLKTLERDTGCRIMIRGRGSIRKDKEAQVRGKPGYEHVFLEPLHVVIEPHSADDVAALRRAREAVELLLVPVPEDRDELKRRQLRELAILNGTFRGDLASWHSFSRTPGTPASRRIAMPRSAPALHSASSRRRPTHVSHIYAPSSSTPVSSSASSSPDTTATAAVEQLGAEFGDDARTPASDALFMPSLYSGVFGSPVPQATVSPWRNAGHE